MDCSNGSKPAEGRLMINHLWQAMNKAFLKNAKTCPIKTERRESFLYCPLPNGKNDEKVQAQNKN